MLLEPVYAFTLEVPQEMVGRAMTDLKQRAGKFDSPEFGTGNGMDYAVLQGTVPVATMQTTAVRCMRIPADSGI